MVVSYTGSQLRPFRYLYKPLGRNLPSHVYDALSTGHFVAKFVEEEVDRLRQNLILILDLGDSWGSRIYAEEIVSIFSAV